MICIYCLTSPSGKSYIGQTTNINKRIQKYKRCDCKNQTKLYNATVKYGFDSFVLTILEECEHDQLNECESFWITYLETVRFGYNLRYGGEGGGFLSESTKIKMGSWQKGKVLSSETKRKMSQSKKGDKCCHFGKKFSIETREKMSRNIKLSRMNKNPNRGIVKNRNKFCVKLVENEIYYCKYGFKTIDEAKIYRDYILNKNI